MFTKWQLKYSVTKLTENFTTNRGKVWGWGKWVKVIKEYKFAVIKSVSSRDVKYSSMVTIVNNITVLYI